MRYGLITLVFAINLTGCAHEVQMVKIHPNCPEIPATTFKAAGLDAAVGSELFGKLVTADASFKLDPKIISGINQSVRDDQTTDALICASRERGELKTPEQVDNAWKKARFHRTNPTADEAIRFYKENQFPATPRSASEMDVKEMQAIRDTLTGGDSFCFLAFVFTSDAPARPHLVISLVGKYALQNIHISIRDVERMQAEVPNLPKGIENARVPTMADLDKIEGLTTHIDVPTLGTTGHSVLGPWNLPDRDQATYQVNLSTPYQKFHQHLKLRRVNSEWIQAFRVHKTGPHRELIVLREHVPDAFPKDQSGKVSWLYY